jgi:predicted transposase/invertase (TIGR01784 family)
MLEQRNPEIRKAVGVLMELSADERMRMLYEAREKARRDEVSRMSGARREGLAEGLEKGLEKGRAEGLEKGRAEGRIEVARNLLKTNMPVADIAAAVIGLPAGEIRRLAGEDR